MFKSGVLLSGNRLSEYTFSGVQRAQSSGAFHSGSSFGVLDVWGYYDRAAMAFSSRNGGGGDTTVQASKTYCSTTTEANECCGTDSYGNPNTCDITRFGAYDYAAGQNMFAGYTSSAIKDIAISGEGGISVSTHCNTSNCSLNWGYYSNNTYAVIKANGTLWIWGDNPYGQIGNGTTAGQFSPVQIGSDTNWDKITGGLHYFLALKTDGTLWSWGLNDNGQLGLGDTTSRSSPVQIGSGTSWVYAHAGYYHSLAIKNDGTLWAWGNNAWGQLGLGNQTNKSSPVQVGSDTRWKKAVCGYQYTSTAINTDGELFSWGSNSNYALGDGTGTSKSIPTLIGYYGYKWIDCREGYAVREDNKLFNWGTSVYSYGGNTNISPTQVGAATDYSVLPSGFQPAIFVSGLSNPGHDTGIPFIDRTGGVMLHARTDNSGRSNVYVGGGAKKIIGTFTTMWVLKDAFAAYKGEDGSGSANTLLGPNPSNNNTYGHSSYFPTSQTVLIDVPGTHSIAVPPNMNTMHVVCIGGGGGGSIGGAFVNMSGGSGGGGALAYKNSISVSPGDTVRVVVGNGGDVSGFGNGLGGVPGNAGSPSYIVHNSNSYAYAGGGGAGGQAAAGAAGLRGAGTYDGGGNGGAGKGGYYASTPGGGGAGGYNGNGGDGAGSSGATTAGSGGGGGGGGHGSGGGGTGINGVGANGSGGVGTFSGGGGGSGGTDGGNSYGAGGTYGGGGSGGFYNGGDNFINGAAGGRGAVKILFSNQSSNTKKRTFPDMSGNGDSSYPVFWI